MKTVLSIGAHPDDIEIGCGGTELLLKEAGYRLIHAVVTDGEEGDIGGRPEDVARIRRKEAEEAAKALGAEDVRFLGAPDGSPAFSKEVKVELIRLIRRFRPEILFTHSSEDRFPDHALVSRLSLAAVEGAKGPWYPLAAGEPHEVRTVLGYEVWNPINRHQLAIDVTKTIEGKLHALGLHRSQVAGVDYQAAVRGLARYRGTMTMKGSFAEAFEVFKIGGLG